MGFEIGMSAQQLLLEIVGSKQDIDSVTFATYKSSISFKSRVAERIRQLSENTSEPAFSDIKEKIILEERVNHDLEDEFQRRYILSIEQLSEIYFEKIESDLDNDQVLAICSICNMKNGTSAHIPMMDFGCEISALNLELITSLVEFIGLDGAVLESGKSYHFYGFDLVNTEEWLSLMAKFLLAAPLTDERYIAHRILGRTSVLRITSAPQKPTVPIVKAIVMGSRV